LQGQPLEGGLLYSFLSGTSQPQSLYADAALTTALPNPLVLDSSGEATYFYGPFTYKLALHDANDVPQWVIDPVTGTGGGGGASAGIGWGQYTVELVPADGATQAAAQVFPPGVLAMGLTLWIAETLGTTQGLTRVGIGTADQPDRWGYLPTLSTATETTAGYFEGYAGHPQAAPEMVTLTAYGGTFDGTGAVYVTGHFCTLTPSHQAGASYVPPAGVAPLPLPPGTTEQAGAVEVATTQEHLDGVRSDVVTTPAGVAAVVAPLEATDATHTSQIATHTSQIAALEATDTTHTSQIAALQATVPPGTPLRVPRYAASGQALESTGVTIDASTFVGVNTPTPLHRLHVQDGNLLLSHASGGVTAILDAPAGQFRTVDFRTANVSRWAFRVQNDAESGGNTGSNLALRRYDDAGGLLTNTLWCERATGNLGLLGVTTFGSGATNVVALRSTGTAPTTSPSDSVQLWGADRGGVAGKGSLHLRSEDGTSHCLGDLSGIATTLTATLGVGSYQTLNVKGSTLHLGQSSTQERAQALIASSFVVSTDATRTSRLALSVYDATSAREGLRIETSGTAPMLGFYGSNAITKPAVTGSRGGNAAVASALSALASLGLITDSSSA
jgi:hypothetical protein